MAEPERTTSQAPARARGLVRLLNRTAHAAVHLLPGDTRRALGWWSWRDLLGSSDEYGVALCNGINGEGPVEALWRRGIPPPEGTIPWPREFNEFHNSWNWDCGWDRVPPSELSTWAAAWKNHPGGPGQVCLDRALVGLSQAGEQQMVRIVIDHGANPSTPRPPASMAAPLMRQLLGAPISMESMLGVLGELCRVAPISWRTWLDQDPWARRRTAGDMEAWRESGLPMPTGEAALLHALAWMHDPPLGGENQSEAMAAVRWWKHHGHLPPDGPTRMLQTFLETARPGDEESYQSGMRAWAAELLDHGLPARPSMGPRWSHMTGVPDDASMPWSHWAAKSTFPESLPACLRDALFSEPDSWTATNLDGKTALDLHMDLVEADESDWRKPGQARLRAWLGSRQMNRLVAPSTQPSASARVPRF